MGAVEEQEARAFLARSFAEYRAPIYSYFLRRTRDAERAEDLTQDVFADAAAALRRSPAVPEPVLPWLYVIARRRLLDARRAEGRQLRQEPLDTALDRQTEAASCGPETARALVSAFRQLRAGHRQVVLMRLLEDRPYAEIAAELYTSEVACRRRLIRGLSELRGILEHAGVPLT